MKWFGEVSPIARQSFSFLAVTGKICVRRPAYVPASRLPQKKASPARGGERMRTVTLKAKSLRGLVERLLHAVLHRLHGIGGRLLCETRELLALLQVRFKLAAHVGSRQLKELGR
jgi:hypothetical protein